MMKFVRITLLVLFVLSVCTAAFADDLNPPPWRGLPGTTFGEWDFLTPDPNPAPDQGFYPYGPPTTEVYPGFDQVYWPELNGRVGVWPLSGEIFVTIPNAQIPNPRKDIWIQLTWEMQVPNVQPAVYEVTTVPNIAAVELQRTPLAGGWFHSTYLIQMFPNPSLEKILITGAVDVDQLVIDTRCVPEPGSLMALSAGLFGLAGMAIRRRR